MSGTMNINRQWYKRSFPCRNAQNSFLTLWVLNHFLVSFMCAGNFLFLFIYLLITWGVWCTLVSLLLRFVRWSNDISIIVMQIKNLSVIITKGRHTKYFSPIAGSAVQLNWIRVCSRVQVRSRALWFVITESLTELQNLLLNMEYNQIDHNLTEILFSGERETFIWGKHSEGVANVWDHPYVISQSLLTPSQTMQGRSDRPRHWLSWQKTTKLITYHNIQSQASGDLLFCKFCQHTVDWFIVDKPLAV